MSKGSEKTILEVTEEQKKEIVSYMADKESRKQAKSEMVEINLKFEHARNDNRYFGKCIVPADLAASLVVADQAALIDRLKVHEGGDHLVEILQSGMTRVVKSVKGSV